MKENIENISLKDNEKMLENKIDILANKINKIFNYINNFNKKNNKNRNNITNNIDDNSLSQLITKYLNNPKILENNQNFLSLYIIELTNYLNTNNNFLVPFLIPTNKLIISYINSDLDEGNCEQNTINFNNIFELLKKNSFIAKDCITPIYSYFSNIFYDISNNEEKKYKLNVKKFRKVLKLWKIFYTFEDNIINSESSFCQLGSSLLITFKEPISLLNNVISIKIKFSDNNKDIIKNNYMEIIDNEIQLIKINDKITVNNNFLKKFFWDKNIYIILISIKIYLKRISCMVIYKTNNSDEIKKEEKNINEKIINDVSNISILANYIGQIKYINIKLLSKKIDKSNNCFSEYLFKPFENINNEYLREGTNNNDKENQNNIFEEENNELYTIKIMDTNLFRTNYINYYHTKFHVVDYFGGIIQILPFADLIKKLYLNEKLSNEAMKDNNKELFITFINDILLGFFNSLLYCRINKKIIKKYYLFFFSLLFELLSTIFKDEDILNKNNDNDIFKIDIYILENLKKIEFYEEVVLHLYVKFTNFGIIEYGELVSEIKLLIEENIRKELIKDNYDFQYFIPLQQLYKKLMNQLFIFNRMWSNKKYFFYDGEKNFYKIKYKQNNHCTKNYQRPILYPILEINKYYPKFKKFNLDKLYKNKSEKILNYNFDFYDKDNIIIRIINEYLTNYINNKKEIALNCCLVKKMYHIKGKLLYKSIFKNNKKKGILIFIANNDSDNKEGCNVSIQNDNNSKEKRLCYGSVFNCPKLNYNLVKVIKFKDILFIMKREYFHRLSGLEIFTYKNKSYLFNFYDYFNIIAEKKKKYTESNVIISKIAEYLRGNITINRENGNLHLGYYNDNFRNYMFPFFHDYYSLFFSNYDKLVFVNLFSNRSFNDIYQYPIFPMFYKNINLNRDMSQHIGFQEINKQSEKRKRDLIYSYEMNAKVGKDERIYLFNLFYSNPIFLSNFLIRLFPYSLLSIEFQGDGFDDPNRIFYSIEDCLNNTLSQKSDLREMIPELFYLPELFFNQNELDLGKKDGGKEIDNVSIYINKSNDFDKYKFITQLRDLLENEKKLDLWIDLIFGVNQKESKEKYQYYNNDYIVKFSNDPNVYKDKYILESTEFGLIPFQLLNYKFPKIKSLNKKDIENIKNYNIELFEKTHIVSNNNKISFICNTQFLVLEEYLNIINKNNINKINYKISSFEKNKFYFIFKGDIFGNLFIYRTYRNMNKNNEENSYKNYRSLTVVIPKPKIKKNNNIIIEEKNEKEKNNQKIHEIKKICDHSKEIKYIDCNPRLNLFLSYSLDGLINIYTFPKYKLVSSIKISNYIDKDHPLIKVALISTPFPMVFCYNELYIFVFTINGELIRKKENNKFIILYPCIDKSLGLIKDNIRIKKSITNLIEYNSEIDLPSLEINYL